MQISFSTSAFALFALVASVRGNLHAACTCVNGDSDNSRLTAAACTAYNAAGYEWGGAFLDGPSGVCTANQGASIAGDQWESACKQMAASGFPCPDGAGICHANPADVLGSC